MTCWSDPESPWFKNEARLGLTFEGYRQVAEFNFGEQDYVTQEPIVVTLYERRSD